MSLSVYKVAFTNVKMYGHYWCLVAHKNIEPNVNRDNVAFFVSLILINCCRSRFSEESPKSCCGLLSWKPGSLRWFIALIALVAVCCVLIGTALGAMRPAGRDHLTVSLLMIGKSISGAGLFSSPLVKIILELPLHRSNLSSYFPVVKKFV